MVSAAFQTSAPPVSSSAAALTVPTGVATQNVDLTGLSDTDDDDDGGDESYDKIFDGSTSSRARIMMLCAEILPQTTSKYLLGALEEVFSESNHAAPQRESVYVAQVIAKLENTPGEAEVRMGLSVCVGLSQSMCVCVGYFILLIFSPFVLRLG